MKNFYYGWIVLLCLTFIYFASNGYGYLSIPAFYPSLTDFFKVQPGVVPQLGTYTTLVIAFFSPLIGYFLDRNNPKRVLIIGVFMISISFYLFTKIENIEHLKYFNIGYAVSLCLGGIITCMYILNKWFDKHRGIALGIFLNASSLGAAFFKPYIGKLLAKNTWQDTSLHLFFIATVLLILPLILIKSQPTDAQKEKSNEFTNQSKSLNFGISLKEAIGNHSFWILITVTMGLWFCINAIIFHNDTFLKDLNLDSVERGKFGGIFFLCGVVGKLLFGFLSDKFNKKNIMIVSIGNILLGAILLKMSITNVELLPIVAVVFGIGYSGSFTMIQLLIADFYMGKHYGTILGVFIMADTLAGAAGIFLLGSLRKSSGSYDSSFLSMIFICVFALFATFIIKKPQPKSIN